MRLPVTLSIHHSRALTIALAVAHLVAVAGLLATDLPVFVKVLALALVALSLGKVLRRDHVSALTLKADGQLSLVFSDDREAACEIDSATTVFPLLIVLRAKTLERTESLILPVDALGIDGHRQLRLWLRWKASVAQA
jgi:toxin CptA